MALQMTSLVMILPLFARRLRDFGAEVDALGQGGWSDRVGRKPILILGLVLFTAQFGGLVVLLTPQLLPRQVFLLAMLMVLALAAVAGLTLRGVRAWVRRPGAASELGPGGPRSRSRRPHPHTPGS